MASSDSNNLINYYGTIGKGLEELAKIYLIRKFKLEQEKYVISDFIEGKIFFLFFKELGNELRNGLKFFERLFVLVHKKRLVDDDGSMSNKRILLDEIYNALINSEQLSNAFQAWKSVQVVAKGPDHTGTTTRQVYDWIMNARSFRLSIKCTGKWRRKIDIDRLCAALGPKIADRMHWHIELRNPNLEISIRISDSLLTIGLPLTKQPLSLRPYIKHMGLRGPVCDAVIQLSDIRQGHRVLDPMCGSGTILFEAVARVEEIIAIGVDIDERKIMQSQENLDHFYANGFQKSIISMFHADCRYLPFLDGTFDSIVCDVPFGQHYSDPKELRILYPAIMKEMLRVLRPRRSKMVLLTSMESYELLRESFENAVSTLPDNENKIFKEFDHYQISLGETNGMIIVFKSVL